MFNTDYYHSRFFNKVIAEGDLVHKSSSNLKKINSEYQFYYYLPETLKSFFVKPFSLVVSSTEARYSMEKIPVLNSAQLLLSGKLNETSFEDLLDEVFKFRGMCPLSGKPSEDIKLESWQLVVVKTLTRLRDFLEYYPLVQRLTAAYKDVSLGRKSWVSRVSHGDLCLSNILWLNNQIKLIDPRGAETESDIYMDEYYDLAKLQHSIFSGYEAILYEKGSIPEYAPALLEKKIKETGADLNLLKVYEAGLFLSMIPLHVDNKLRTEKFAKKAEEILSTLGY